LFFFKEFADIKKLWQREGRGGRESVYERERCERSIEI